MPSATSEDSFVAVDHVRNNLDQLADTVHANDDDINFLRDILDDQTLQSLVSAYDCLELKQSEAHSNSATDACMDVIEVLKETITKSPDADELKHLLLSPHFSALLYAHDDIAVKNFEEFPQDSPINPLSEPYPPGIPIHHDMRIVGVSKSKSESLGITVKVDENNDLIIARIMTGSVIDKQGLLHVGDIIQDVNGFEVHSPEQLMDIVRRCPTNLNFKIIPMFNEQHSLTQVYMKAHFNYDPQKDRLLPCKEVGLPFRDGDILQILSSDDANWWQARRVEDEMAPSGLIPSQSLEEKRKAFVKPEYDHSKSWLCGLRRRKTAMYSSNKAGAFDKCELMVYEEVTKMPPFQRKTLALIGPNGIGKRSLKERLIRDDPRKFGSAMPHTSRAPREDEVDGSGYYFTTHEEMVHDIRDDKYLEHGNFHDNLYGTRQDTIQKVIDAGKMCVLDVNPTCLKKLKTGMFAPYIVFVAAPDAEALRVMYEEGMRRGLTKTKTSTGQGVIEMKTESDFLATVKESSDIEHVYRAYFDLTIVNDDYQATYRELRQAINKLSTENQWVPVNWVY